MDGNHTSIHYRFLFKLGITLRKLWAIKHSDWLQTRKQTKTGEISPKSNCYLISRIKQLRIECVTTAFFPFGETFFRETRDKFVSHRLPRINATWNRKPFPFQRII